MPRKTIKLKNKKTGKTVKLRKKKELDFMEKRKRHNKRVRKLSANA